MSVLCRIVCALLMLSMPSIGLAREVTVCMVGDDDLPTQKNQAQWLVREAFQREGHTVSFFAVPWARCLLGVERGRYDAALGAAANAKFLSYMRFPLLNGEADSSKSLGSIKLVVLRRVGSSVEWDGHTFSGLTTAIMYRRGHASLERKLNELDVLGDQNSNSDHQTLDKLLAGRGDAAVCQLELAQALLEHYPYNGKLEILPVSLLELPVYLGVNLTQYEADPRFYEAVWAQIKQLRSAPEGQTPASDLTH